MKGFVTTCRIMAVSAVIALSCASPLLAQLTSESVFDDYTSPSNSNFLTELRNRAEQGDAQSQYALGAVYFYGQLGVSTNTTEAAIWWTKSAEQGHPRAQNDLGALYEKGIGVKQSLKKAIDLYRQASEQGNAQAPNNLAQAEASLLHQNVYRLQHRVLPVLTHQTNGRFVELLLRGDTNKLYEVASNEVSSAFADKMTVKLLNNPTGILLMFPTPNKAPECFFAYITKTEDSYRYITLEKTLDIFEHGNKSVVGEWSAEKKHLNCGSRKYDDEESFLAEIRPSGEK